MAKFQDPVLFSTHYGIDIADLEAAGLIDPLLDVDTPLFIDPVLLGKSDNPRIRKDALKRFRDHFSKIIRLLDISAKENDAAWKAARHLLDLSEPPENGLGYGGSGRSGSSRPDDIREAILRTTKEIVTLGSKDPEMISLMGFFEEGVGADTISDFTTSVILEDLAYITEDFCKKHNIPVYQQEICPNYKLPKYVVRKREIYLVLVPQDIVRDLPVANDWSGIEAAAMENAAIRERVSRLLGGITHPTVLDRKAALRSAALGSANDFGQFLATVKANTSSYDPIEDILGFFRAKEIIAHGFEGLKQDHKYDFKNDKEQIVHVVNETLALFKRHVELGNLWEELWAGTKPKKERASQIIYHAIADAFCKANDIDISPEANMGGGPIDFKFSKGYNARVLVEMKRSGGTVQHGYEKQLEFYKAASQTDTAIFVVMDYGNMGNKLATIKKIRNTRISAGERASDILVIDTRKKASASKRH